MVKIKLVLLGDTYPLDVEKIVKFGEQSQIFSITEQQQILEHHILTDNLYEIPDDAFHNLGEGIIDPSNDGFTVVIVNRRLQHNFFSRRINNHLIIVSMYDFNDLKLQEGISIEMIINRFLLGFSTIFHVYGGLTVQAAEVMQADPIGCLFDLCINKSDVARFFINPKISSRSLSILALNNISSDFLIKLKSAIKKLELGHYYKLRFWLKNRPFTTIAITLLVPELISELIQLLKCILNCKCL